MQAGATVQRQGMSQESLVPRESEDRRQGGKYWGGAGSQLDGWRKVLSWWEEEFVAPRKDKRRMTEFMFQRHLKETKKLLFSMILPVCYPPTPNIPAEQTQVLKVREEPTSCCCPKHGEN